MERLRSLLSLAILGVTLYAALRAAGIDKSPVVREMQWHTRRLGLAAARAASCVFDPPWRTELRNYANPDDLDHVITRVVAIAEGSAVDTPEWVQESKQS